MLCDFGPNLPVEAQANLEASLEGAGLLDAWVTPDGELLPSGEQDAVLVAGRSVLPERSLAELLQPTDGSPVVEAVLRHIGLESGPAWVSVDGRWQLGPMHGSHTKERAEHIGEGARQRLRMQRLEELERQLAELDDKVNDLEKRLEVLQERQRALRREVESVPSRRGVFDARAAIREAERLLVRARDRLIEAERHTEERRQAAEERRRIRDQDARDTSLSEWVDRLEELRELLQRAESAADKARLQLEFARRAEETARLAVSHLAESRVLEGARLERLTLAERELLESEARLKTLEETVGQAVETILQRLADTRQEQKRLHADLQRLSEEGRKLERQIGRLESDATQAEESLQAAAADRHAAVNNFASLAAQGVMALAAPGVAVHELDRSITRAVEVAREVEQAIGELDAGEEAWRRAQSPLFAQFEQLKSELPSQDYRPEATPEGDIFLVAVVHLGQRQALDVAIAGVEAEIEQRQRLLTAREREVIENHLVNEIAEHLHQLLFRGERWVDQVNEELMQRPTSSGMRFQFKWVVREDGPSGLEHARKRLLRASGTWSRQERDQVGEFLQRQIQDARKLNPEGGWLEHLTAGLDYRSWHMFQVFRELNGVSTRLTRRTYGTGSGGEKAFALTVPQFAAAAAYYKNALPEAPRLILLDEAFVGVDARMRGQCMGMLETFDLDFIMTSEREWGNFAELKGVAIYQMSSHPGIDAVHVSRWTWDGRRLAPDPIEPRPLFAEIGV
jgi:uncharacterized protein (TIGR02680 family)